MDRFEAISTLLAAVDAGSLSGASRQLGIPLPTVSRRVADLEEHLKVRLLLRGNRKLTLTDAGRAYVASCRRIMEEMAEADRTAIGEYNTPQGEIVFSVPVVMGRIVALPVVVQFLRAYPSIKMRVQLTDRNVSLLDEHIDIALRVGKLPDSNLVATCLGGIRRVICASPTYLNERGKPQVPGDLSAHECVGFETLTEGTNWDFQIKDSSERISIPTRLIVNTVDGAVTVASEGGGIARVLSYQIANQVAKGELISLLEEYEPALIPVSLIYPRQRQVPLKTRAFLDFATPRLRERLGGKATD